MYLFYLFISCNKDAELSRSFHAYPFVESSRLIGSWLYSMMTKIFNYYSCEVHMSVLNTIKISKLPSEQCTPLRDIFLWMDTAVKSAISSRTRHCIMPLTHLLGEFAHIQEIIQMPIGAVFYSWDGPVFLSFRENDSLSLKERTSLSQ